LVTCDLWPVARDRSRLAVGGPGVAWMT